jgi:hypothetical protein
MAYQSIFGNMLGQGHPAAAAAEHKAAPPALDKGGATPPVKKEYHLFPIGYRRINGL